MKSKDQDIVENIDIGGPTMVRATAKNFKNILISTNKSDYRPLIKELERNKGKTSIKFREYVVKSIWLNCLLRRYDS